MVNLSIENEQQNMLKCHSRGDFNSPREYAESPRE